MTFVLMLIASVFAIGGAELALKARFNFGRSGRNAKVAPHNATSFHTASGERISQSDGYIAPIRRQMLGEVAIGRNQKSLWCGLKGGRPHITPHAPEALLMRLTGASLHGWSRAEGAEVAEVAEVADTLALLPAH